MSIVSSSLLTSWFGVAIVLMASCWTTSFFNTATAFVVVPRGESSPFAVVQSRQAPTTTMLWSTPEDEDDQKADPDGASLAAQLFQMAQAKGVSVDADDLIDDDEDDEDDEEDDDEEDDEPEPNFPAGAVNAFLGYDQGITKADDALAGNVSLTDNQLYSEVKERVLDTAGGFVQYVKGASDDDDEDEDDSDDDDDVVLAGEGSRMSKQKYTPPTTVPDSDLTAGEVVTLVLQALANNDNPTPNRGVEILFGYSSAGSQIKNEAGLTPAEYGEFLKETEYKVLFTHEAEEVVRSCCSSCLSMLLGCELVVVPKRQQYSDLTPYFVFLL